MNTIVLATLAYVLWRYLLSPLSNLLQNFLELFRKRELECLEITPPVNNNVDPEHTQSFLNVILGQHQRQRLSLEIISDKKNGIRYRIVAEAYAINNIKKQISAYLPEVKVKESKGVKAKTSSIIYTFKQQRHFAFPLKTYTTNQNSDPIAFIAGALTRLNEKDQLTMQLVIRPYSSRQAISPLLCYTFSVFSLRGPQVEGIQLGERNRLGGFANSAKQTCFVGTMTNTP